MPPELEALDKLCGGDMTLAEVRQLFPDDSSFLQGVHWLLLDGDVRLFASTGAEVPRSSWHELFVEGRAAARLTRLQLSITEQGARSME